MLPKSDTRQVLLSDNPASKASYPSIILSTMKNVLYTRGRESKLSHLASVDANFHAPVCSHLSEHCVAAADVHDLAVLRNIGGVRDGAGSIDAVDPHN